MLDRGSKNVLIKFMIMDLGHGVSGSATIWANTPWEFSAPSHTVSSSTNQSISSSLTPVPLRFSFNAWADSGMIPRLSYTSICHSFGLSGSTISWRYLTLMSTAVGMWSLYGVISLCSHLSVPSAFPMFSLKICEHATYVHQGMFYPDKNQFYGVNSEYIYILGSFWIIKKELNDWIVKNENAY